MGKVVKNSSNCFVWHIFKKRIFFLFIIFLWMAGPVYSSEELISCEVLDVSGQNHADNKIYQKIKYILFHHANAKDREQLSSYLKRNNGKEILFSVNGKRYQGILYRMPHCFGRGLIIHMNDISLKKRDLFDLVVFDK